jgi:hypothetical protein
VNGNHNPNFQEKKMRKMLLATALVLCFGAFAAAKSTTYTYTFGTTGGSAFCDGVTLVLSGTPKTVVGGTHTNYNCGGANSNVGGFKAAVASVYQYAATGATLLVSDPLYGLGGHNESALYHVNTTYQTWVLDADDGSGLFVVSYGVLLTGEDAPAKGAGTKSSSQPQ